MIDGGPIGQQHISKRAPVPVLAVHLDGDFLPKGEVDDGVLGLLAERLAFLGAVDAAEADAFRALVVKDFDGVSVNYPDYSSGEVGS